MLKILLVEDDKDLNMLTSAYLKDAGFIVKSLYNGLDALNELDSNHYDIILSDIMMPLCDGFELARTIRENNKEIPILFNMAINYIIIFNTIINIITIKFTIS